MISRKLRSLSAIVANAQKHSCLCYSSASALRTTESNPTKLNESHLGRFFVVEKDLALPLYGPVDDVYSLPEKFKKQCNTFRETALLVRRPFLTIKNDIESYGLKLPPLKFVLYGERGNGKSLTLAHLSLYGYASKFVLFNVPWVSPWMRWPRELLSSTLQEGYFDHTEDSIMWLTFFRRQNSQLFKDNPLKITRDYKWNAREITPEGSDLLSLVEHGIARPVYAAGSICAIIQELKTLASSGKCKVMVLIDGFNGLYAQGAIKMKMAGKTLVEFDKVTVFNGWKEFMKPDWTGGVVITTVDATATAASFRKSDYPRYLLQKEGWELLDPFIPIEVDRYTKTECYATIDYYLDRKWLQHPKANTPEAKHELEVLSVRKPFELMHMCNAR